MTACVPALPIFGLQLPSSTVDRKFSQPRKKALTNSAGQMPTAQQEKLIDKHFLLAQQFALLAEQDPVDREYWEGEARVERRAMTLLIGGAQ